MHCCPNPFLKTLNLYCLPYTRVWLQHSGRLRQELRHHAALASLLQQLDVYDRHCVADDAELQSVLCVDMGTNTTWCGDPKLLRLLIQQRSCSALGVCSANQDLHLVIQSMSISALEPNRPNSMLVRSWQHLAQCSQSAVELISSARTTDGEALSALRCLTNDYLRSGFAADTFQNSQMWLHDGANMTQLLWICFCHWLVETKDLDA
eukprot:SAG31_NODE_8543_length_1432_cov_5.499020_1_plen_206_part_10